MQWLWWIIGINLVAGLLVATIGLLTAGDGYEDESGFHAFTPSGRRLIQDSDCSLPGTSQSAT